MLSTFPHPRKTVSTIRNQVSLTISPARIRNVLRRFPANVEAAPNSAPRSKRRILKHSAREASMGMEADTVVDGGVAADEEGVDIAVEATVTPVEAAEQEGIVRSSSRLVLRLATDLRCYDRTGLDGNEKKSLDDD